jgi:hypothetical protein
MFPYKNIGKKLLGSFALFYFLVQWVGARRMDGNVIFSGQRASDRANLDLLFQQLSGELRDICTTGSMRRIIFADTDVLLPYVLSTREDASFGQCEFIRPTNVTPISESVFTGCNSIRVAEYTPFMRARKPFLVLDPILPAKDWTEMFRWTSPQGDLGFALFKRADCVDVAEAGNAER